MLALQGVIFAYDGWVGIVYFGEEVQHPGRDIAIAAEALPTATAAAVVFGASGDTLV